MIAGGCNIHVVILLDYRLNNMTFMVEKTRFHVTRCVIQLW